MQTNLQQIYQMSVSFDWVRVRGLGLDWKIIWGLEEMLFAGFCINFGSWFIFFLTLFFSGTTGNSCNKQIQEMQVGVKVGVSCACFSFSYKWPGWWRRGHTGGQQPGKTSGLHQAPRPRASWQMVVTSLYNRKKPIPPNISTRDTHKHTQSLIFPLNIKTSQ